MKNHLNATGIIVEYNPFHNGHFYHIQKAKEITPDAVIIAVMSPNFVQRGEPAFVNKWERTKAALEHGVDLVVELPTVYAIQSADYFAKASVEILALMGVSDIVFGSESGDLNFINKVAPSPKNTKISFASNVVNALKPNDILGSQYLLNAQNFNIKCHAIKRTNSYHDTSIKEAIASASAIRGNYGITDLKHTTPIDLDSMIIHRLEDYEMLIKAKLYEESKTLSNYLLVSEGIENLIIKHRQLPLQEMIEKCTSKKYTRSRIQRTLISILLGIKKTDVKPINEVRVLGMNSKGKKYLAALRDDERSHVKSFKHYCYKDVEIKASALYSLVKGPDYFANQNANELKNIIIIDSIIESK